MPIQLIRDLREATLGIGEHCGDDDLACDSLLCRGGVCSDCDPELSADPCPNGVCEQDPNQNNAYTCILKEIGKPCVQDKSCGSEICIDDICSSCDPGDLLACPGEVCMPDSSQHNAYSCQQMRAVDELCQSNEQCESNYCNIDTGLCELNSECDSLAAVWIIDSIEFLIDVEQRINAEIQRDDQVVSCSQSVRLASNAEDRLRECCDSDASLRENVNCIAFERDKMMDELRAQMDDFCTVNSEFFEQSCQVQFRDLQQFQNDVIELQVDNARCLKLPEEFENDCNYVRDQQAYWERFLTSTFELDHQGIDYIMCELGIDAFGMNRTSLATILEDTSNRIIFLCGDEV